MSIFTSYWFWIVVALFVGLWYSSRRGHGGRNIAVHGNPGIGSMHGQMQNPTTIDGEPQLMQKQERRQGHKGHGGCCG